MMSNWTSLLTNIASRYFRKTPKASARHTRNPRPHVEQLENRLAPAITYNVTSLVDGAPGSLRDAIDQANTDGVDSIIRLKTNRTYEITLDGTDENANADGDYDIFDDGSLSIIGGSKTTTRITTEEAERIFDVVDANVVLKFQNLTIRDGDATGQDDSDGGGVNAPKGDVVLNFNNVCLLDNSANDGGGFFIKGGDATLTNCRISNNFAIFDGVGFNEFGGGGGFNLFGDGDEVLKVTGCTITSNDSESDGGGIKVSRVKDVFISKTIISGNTAALDGGGMRVGDLSGTFSIIDSDIRSNDAEVGGGIWTAIGNGLIIARSQIRANTAVEEGGGLFTPGLDTLTVHRSTIDHNTAGGAGGGVWMRMNGDINFTNSTFGFNESHDQGGALYMAEGVGSIDFDSCTIAYNFATIAGSALFIADSNDDVTFQNCIIAKNEFAPGQFGGFAPVSAGHNLLSFDATGAFNDPGDLKGTEAAPLNPGLGVLGYWNGGTTKTFPLLSTILDANGVRVRNKAINNGLTDLTNDQNGSPRGPKDDIGAYEKVGQD